jgi:hypothetical protein
MLEGTYPDQCLRGAIVSYSDFKKNLEQAIAAFDLAI